MYLALFLVLEGVTKADWPQFRGPNGSGVSNDRGLPVQFGLDQNVMWKIALPPGHSSPVVSGARLFITAFQDSNLLTLCLNRKTGEMIWRREIPRERHEKHHPHNTPATPTPVTDGNNVYVFFADFGLISYGQEGRERWRVRLGPFNNAHGMASSPIIAGNKLVLVCDQETNSFLIAIDKDNGKICWKTERPEVIQGFATPIFFQAPEGPSQLIVPGSFQLIAYSLATGQKLWWIHGLNWQPKTVPLLDQNILYFLINTWGTGDPGNQVIMPEFEEVLQEYDKNRDGFLSLDEAVGPNLKESWSVVDLNKNGTLDKKEWDFYRSMLTGQNGLFAIRPGGRGDLTTTNLLWRYWKSLPNVCSPVLYNGILFMVKDGGVVTSLNPRNGTVLKQGRLHDGLETYFASLVAADGKIFMVSVSGKITVLRAMGEWEILAVNDLGEECYATPAIVDGKLYIRTRQHLYCFGKTSNP